MKDVISFIKWQLRRIKFYDVIWIGSWMSLSYGYLTDNKYSFIVGGLVIFSLSVGWLVKLQWSRWKEERKQLFKTIKEST